MLAERGPDRRRPWSLLTDGDLWAQWQRGARQKGPASVRVSWNTGHATAEAVSRGVTTEARRAGNAQSDEDAYLGVLRGHLDGTLERAGYYAHKQLVLEKLAMSIQMLQTWRVRFPLYPAALDR